MSRSRPILPYRVLPADVVVPAKAGWTVVVNGERVAQLVDGAAFPSWDAKLSFRLERSFRFESDVAREVRLDADGTCCELVVTVGSAAGLARQVLYREPIPWGTGSEQEVVIYPRSDRIARDIVITSGVYLCRDIESRDPLAPRVRGSRLWELSERVRLEGGAARLPMYEVAFSKAFVGDRIGRAEFHVEVSDDPELDIESAVTVYLNSECPDFIAEVSRAGSAAERRLWSGIIRRAIASAVLSDWHMNTKPASAQALSATIHKWALHIWRDVPPDKLRELATTNYSKFEAQIESWLDGFDDRQTSGGPK